MAVPSPALCHDVRPKENSIRMYDEEGYVKRAACICVRNEAETEVLLVTSSRRDGQWIIPGGGVEPEENFSEAAIREVAEEAGVKGRLGRCLGVFENEERKSRTSVFVLLVTEELSEWEDSQRIGRQRKWFRLDQAIQQLSETRPAQSNYLRLLQNSTISKNTS